MYNLASKLLEPLADPLVWAILLMLAALLLWRRRGLARWLSVASVLVLVVFSTKIGERALVLSLENQTRDVGLDVPPRKPSWCWAGRSGCLQACIMRRA